MMNKIHGAPQQVILVPLGVCFLSSNILLVTLSLHFLGLCSSVSRPDQVLDQYRIAGETVVLYALVFMFLDTRYKDKHFELNCSKYLRN